MIVKVIYADGHEGELKLLSRDVRTVWTIAVGEGQPPVVMSEEIPPEVKS